MSNLETMTFEKSYVEKIVVTSESIKDPEILSSVLEQKCSVITKKSANRPWLYIKEDQTLKTIGGIRMNKNSIGTFYLDTILEYPLNEILVGVVSREQEKFISNRIIINDLKSLEKICEIISDLIENEKVYIGTRN